MNVGRVDQPAQAAGRLVQNGLARSRHPEAAVDPDTGHVVGHRPVDSRDLAAQGRIDFDPSR